MAIAAPASAPDGTLTGFEAQQGLNTLESPSSGADGITGDICPAATDNPLINLQNRRDAIETGRFGPLDPSLPNNEYWQEAAAEWNASIEFVKHARCGNCAAFNITTAMRECISAGSQSLDAWVLVEAGQLGYCEVFDFRCAAKRRCNMWVAGGPLTDDLAQQFTGYDYDLEEYKSDAALFKFNPNHDDDTGRFSTGGGGGSAGAEGGSGSAEINQRAKDIADIGGVWIDNKKVFGGQVKYNGNIDADLKNESSSRTIPLKELYATQDWTQVEKSVSIAKGGKKLTVHVARIGTDKYAILDGHHNAAAAYLRGNKSVIVLVHESTNAIIKMAVNQPRVPKGSSAGGQFGAISGAEGGSATTSQIATVAMTRGVLTSAKVPVGSASSTGFTIRAGAQTIQKNGYVQVTHVPTAGTSREVRVAEVAHKLEAYNKLFKNAGFKTQLINRAMATEQGTIAQVRVYSKESVKFNPSHDSAGRFSSGSSSGSSAAARAGKLAKELESKLGDKSGPPHGFAADGARREDDTDEDEESAHYDYIKTLPKKTQDAIERYTQSSEEINGLLRDHPKIFEQARELHASGDRDIQSAASIAVQAAGFPRGTPEASMVALTMDAVRIDKAIAEAPPMKERVVLRGLVGTNTTLDVIVERANSDGVVKLKGIVSASTDPSVAQRFTLGNDGVDKPYVMEIRTKRGLLVEGISGQGEQEVLLRPNANYKILGTGTGKYSERNAAKELPTLQLQLLGNLGE